MTDGFIVKDAGGRAVWVSGFEHIFMWASFFLLFSHSRTFPTILFWCKCRFFYDILGSPFIFIPCMTSDQEPSLWSCLMQTYSQFVSTHLLEARPPVPALAPCPAQYREPQSQSSAVLDLKYWLGWILLSYTCLILFVQLILPISIQKIKRNKT